ncbi:MAG TPA: hypothetical protein VEL11_18695 [Candidatus Bathyarchaeia archaeon]|nr:hypothetical protein [Candidatus Bathyarchaeia archaeon]
MKDPYHCPYCNQRSTRHWNLQVHTKRKHGGSLDPYLASHPSYNVQSDQFGSATVAESAGDTFLNTHLHQQTPVPIPIYRPPPTIHDQSHETGLSHAAVQKIQEFKVLMNKYPLYHTNPDGIIRLAIYNSINGDDALPDNKLAIDSLAKYYASSLFIGSLERKRGRVENLHLHWVPVSCTSHTWHMESLRSSL